MFINLNQHLMIMPDKASVFEFQLLRSLFIVFLSSHGMFNLSAQEQISADGIIELRIQQIERKISESCHSLINEFRKENLMLPMHWNESLYRAANNHNVWMAMNNDLTHIETKRDTYFTGRGIVERIEHVSFEPCKVLCGENCLFFYVESEIDSVITDELVHEFAMKAFLMWRSSPGHRDNMLTNYDAHGVAFHFSGGGIWATDVFYGENTDPYYYSLKRKLNLRLKMIQIWLKRS